VAKVELTLEEQIAKLNGQVTDLTTKSEAKDRTIAEQKGKLDSQGKELADAIQARDTQFSIVGQAATRIRELEQEAEANEQTIKGYETQLRTAEAAGDGSIVVKHEEQLYRVVIPQFHFEGKVVKADALKTDATLVGKLVEAKSGVLELVEA
jgi:chromosome segregation ATPase